TCHVAHSMTIILFSSFFFYSHAYHLNLHSFPTRRSSDLLYKFIVNFANRLFNCRGKTAMKKMTRNEFLKMIGSGVEIRYESSFRSEEHTSELQSRFDLVCRLLLEKKKHQQQNTHRQELEK